MKSLKLRGGPISPQHLEDLQVNADNIKCTLRQCAVRNIFLPQYEVLATLKNGVVPENDTLKSQENCLDQRLEQLCEAHQDALGAIEEIRTVDSTALAGIDTPAWQEIF